MVWHYSIYSNLVKCFICFAAGENNLPHNYIRALEDWCLCQAISSLEETGKLSEAEALCSKVWWHHTGRLW